MKVNPAAYTKLIYLYLYILIILRASVNLEINSFTPGLLGWLLVVVLFRMSHAVWHGTGALVYSNCTREAELFIGSVIDFEPGATENTTD